VAWGSSGHGGTDAPSGSGYTKIYSTVEPPLKTNNPCQATEF
jgi:hypothetical protein